MNGLLIEDDQAKANKIISYISQNFPSFQVDHQMSYKSGLNSIFNYNYDFILLDMSLPSYDQGSGSFSGKPKNFGGRDIMKEMKRHGKISIVKVFTQYNDFDGGLISMAELDEELKEKYSKLYKGYISYNSKESDWQAELQDFLISFAQR
jgi:DNA-binding NarL/FixJ family response regulator